MRNWKVTIYKYLLQPGAMTSVESKSIFVKLPSFDNLDDQPDKLKEFLETKARWYVDVTEKLHGASVAIEVGPSSIRYGKRGGYLESGESFYGLERVDKKYQGALHQARLLIIKRYDIDSSAAIMFYGELVGGQYNHPDVKKVEEAVRVQKDANYAPDAELAIFAVKCPNGWNAEAFRLGGSKVPPCWMSYHDLADVCTESKLPCVPHIFSGTVEELFKQYKDPEEIYTRKTIFPSKLGLPEIKDNWAEGVVMKLYPDSPNKQLVPFGLTFKWKHRLQREKAKKAAAGNIKTDATKLSSELIQTALGYINQPRVAAYFSKLSQTERENAKRNLGHHIHGVRQDALEEFFKDLGEVPLKRKDMERQLIGEMSNQAKTVILAFLAN